MGLLRDYLPRNTYGVVGTYHQDDLVAAVAGVSIDDSDGLLLQFPHSHGFCTADLVTVQLDNRLAVRTVTPDLPIHRTSYKGVVTKAAPGFVEVRPVQFQVFFSDRMVEEFRAPGYTFPVDQRPEAPLRESPHGPEFVVRDDDASTNLGVLFTRAPERPHSTVMAFLSAGKGDVFLVTQPHTFKAHNLFRNGQVVFAVDYRDSYDLDKPLDWAYRLLPMHAYRITADRPLYRRVTEAFLQKNPWNAGFFAAPGAVVLHLAPTVG